MNSEKLLNLANTVKSASALKEDCLNLVRQLDTIAMKAHEKLSHAKKLEEEALSNLMDYIKEDSNG